MDRRPNIVIICTDQHRYDVLGAYGIPTCAHHAAPRPVWRPKAVPLRALLHAQSRLRANARQHPYRALPAVPTVCGATAYRCPSTSDSPHPHPRGCRLTHCGLVTCTWPPTSGDATERRLRRRLPHISRWSHAPNHRSPENTYHRWLESAPFPALYQAAEAACCGRPGARHLRHDDQRPQLRRHADRGALHPLGRRRDHRLPAGRTRDHPSGHFFWLPTSSTPITPSSPRRSTWPGSAAGSVPRTGRRAGANWPARPADDPAAESSRLQLRRSRPGLHRLRRRRDRCRSAAPTRRWSRWPTSASARSWPCWTSRASGTRW